MKLFELLAIGCLVIVAGQALAQALAVALLLALVWGLFNCPRETLGFLGLCIVGGLIERFPLVCIALIALAVIARQLRV